MKPEIHSVSCLNHPNVETWEPDDPADVVEDLIVDIGPGGKKVPDIFTVRVATPKGLAGLDARDGVVATRALVVIDRYDFWSVYTWLKKIVAMCGGTTWEDCASELRRYFHWEYEGMKAFYDVAAGASGNNATKLVIHSVSCRDHRNIRTLDPDDPAEIAEELTLKIGPNGTKDADVFTIRVATPSGLARLPAVDGIIAMRPLVVVDRYDFEPLWAWLQQTVEECEADTWLSCVDELRVYFAWEHESVKV